MRSEPYLNSPGRSCMVASRTWSLRERCERDGRIPFVNWLLRTGARQSIVDQRSGIVRITIALSAADIPPI